MRLARSGIFVNDFEVARNSARSRALHSHSRLARKLNVEGNASVLIVVSTWNTVGPLSRSTSPIRQMLWCSAEWWRSIRLFVFCSASGLWWWARHRYEASPVTSDFHPPSIATWLTLA